jgi:hemerythrin
MLNELHAAMMQGQVKYVTGSLLDKLAKYTRSHFEAEESMMEMADYPGLEQHKTKHQQLLQQVNDFVVRYQRGEGTLDVHLLIFLRDWLTHHIQVEDHAYGPYMIASRLR